MKVYGAKGAFLIRYKRNEGTFNHTVWESILSLLHRSVAMAALLAATVMKKTIVSLFNCAIML